MRKLKMNGKSFKAIIAGTFVSIITLGPIIPGRYVFLLDSVFGPDPELFQSFAFGNLILNSFLFFISNFSPFLYPKILMFTSIFLSFFFAWLLLKNYLSEISAYTFSIFYAVNPFIYNRMIAGQVFIPFSYAFLPLIARFLMEERNWKKDVLIGCLISLGSLQLHLLPMMIGMAILFRGRDYLKGGDADCLKSVGIIFAIVAILNSGLIYDFLIGGPLARRIGSITISHLEAFKPVMAPGINHITSVATLHGFWRQVAYIQIWDYLPRTWFLLFFPILFLAVHGYMQNPPYRNVFAAIGVIGLILGTGVANPIFDSAFRFLFENVPFFTAYRDSQKLAALLALTYAYLGAFGIQELLGGLRKNRKIYYGAGILVFILPLAYGYPMLFGFQGQVKPADYPRDWYQAKNLIDNQKEDFRVLFLPWHLYMDFSWVPNRDKRIATPASAFLRKPVIQSRNPDMPGVTPPQDDVSKAVGRFLKTGDARILNKLDVKYVILAKQADYRNYIWILRKENLKLVMSTLHLYILKNKAWEGLRMKLFIDPDLLQGVSDEEIQIFG